MYTFIFVWILIIVLFIVWIYNWISFEHFSNSEPLTLLIFVSKTCRHCIDYNDNYHDAVVKIAQSKGIKVIRIFADQDPNKLFNKYKVMFVPTAILIKGDKVYKNLGSNITPETIRSALSN